MKSVVHAFVLYWLSIITGQFHAAPQSDSLNEGLNIFSPTVEGSDTLIKPHAPEGKRIYQLNAADQSWVQYDFGSEAEAAESSSKNSSRIKINRKRNNPPVTTTNPRKVNNEVLIQFNRGVTNKSVRIFFEKNSFYIINKIGDIYHVGTKNMRQIEVKDLIRENRSNPIIEHIQPNFIYQQQ